MLLPAAVILSMLPLYLAGQPAPAGGVQRFGDGVLDGGEVFRGSFAPDGRSFYFFRKVGRGEEYRIFVSQRTGETWSAPAVVSLGGEFSDLYPSISRDGRRMVFSSYRRVPGAPSTLKPNAHLWYADRVGDAWGTPVFMRQASTPGHYHSWVEFGFDDAVYFRRTTADWTVTQTMRSAWTGTEYGAAAPYPDAERWKGWRSDVRVVGGSPGPGGTLVFLDVATTNPRTGRPASDIWISRKRGDAWTDPAPLGAGINSDGFDAFPFVSPDGRDLYFVRDFATFHRIPLDEALASTDATPAVRYVANSGMLLTHSRRRFLIDAPIRDGIEPYATSAADERQRLETARAPYHDVDAILVTHWHEDHFSAEAIAAHLRHNPRAVLVSSPEVVDRVRTAAAGLADARFRAILPEPGSSQQVEIGGVPVRVLRIRHNPARRVPEQHVGFLVGHDAPVLHVGDADPAADNFTLLRSLPAIDLAMLPFWYVSGESNRRMVADLIRPRRIIAMHVPPADAGEIGESLRVAGVNALVAAEPGTDLR